MKLFEKLVTIQSRIDVIVKNKEGHQYTYADGSRVLGVIRPMMNEFRLLLKQEITDVTHEVITYATRNGEKTEVLAKVRFKFTWVDSETGDTDINEWAADGMNGFDKSIGSAMTYGERYFLLKYFHIPTDELDNDALGEKAGYKGSPAPSNAPTPKTPVPVSPTPKPSSPNEPENWLNKEDKEGFPTAEWASVVDRFKAGEITSVADVRKLYKVSRAIAAELNQIGIQ